MSFPEEVVVVPKSFVVRASFFRRLWIVGWLAASLSCAVTSYVYGLYEGRRDSLRQSAELANEIRKTAELQGKVTTSFIAAWEDMHSFAEVNISWADYVREREVRIDENRGRVAERKKR